MNLPVAFGVVVAADLAGLAVAVATDMVDLREGLLAGTPLNAPFPFVAVQAGAVAAVRRARGGRRATAATMLAALGVVSIASGFFDGGYAAEGYGLTLAERGIQATIVGGTAVMTALAARLVRSPARAAVAAA